jgi:hypothetical protein
MALVVLALKPKRPLAGPASSGAPSAEPAKPDPVLAEIDAAKKEGHAALEQLADKHPKHARVLYELAVSHAAQSEHSDAVAALGRALEADAKISEETGASDLLAAAVRQRDSETANAAYKLLEGPMGGGGAGVIYDLSFDQKILASTRSRAQKWVVQSPEFLKVAPPSVEVAAKLRYGKSCADRHAVLQKAGEVGDKRALAYMKIMKVRSGCGRRGRDDCFSCLRKDKALEEAMAAIEKRMGDKP